jgi:hypothetical protein
MGENRAGLVGDSVPGLSHRKVAVEQRAKGSREEGLKKFMKGGGNLVTI